MHWLMHRFNSWVKWKLLLINIFIIKLLLFFEILKLKIVSVIFRFITIWSNLISKIGLRFYVISKIRLISPVISRIRLIFQKLRFRSFFQFFIFWKYTWKTTNLLNERSSFWLMFVWLNSCILNRIFGYMPYALIDRLIDW